MHECQNVLQALGIAGSLSPANTPLNSASAQKLKLALKNDTQGFARHSALALAEGISGIHQHRSTWAAVKFYYSVFYCARAYLGISNYCIFYSGKTPYSIEVSPGGRASKLKGNTHEAVLQEFKNRFSSSVFLSQEIEQENPLDWICSKRVLANYRNAGPFEPQILGNLTAVVQFGLRKVLSLYLNDTQWLYTFDKDHALLAFPLRFFIDLVAKLNTEMITPFDEDFSKIMDSLIKDNNGPINPLIIKI